MESRQEMKYEFKLLHQEGEREAPLESFSASLILAELEILANLNPIDDNEDAKQLSCECCEIAYALYAGKIIGSNWKIHKQLKPKGRAPYDKHIADEFKKRQETLEGKRSPEKKTFWQRLFPDHQKKTESFYSIFNGFTDARTAVSRVHSILGDVERTGFIKYTSLMGEKLNKGISFLFTILGSFYALRFLTDWGISLKSTFTSKKTEVEEYELTQEGLTKKQLHDKRFKAVIRKGNRPFRLINDGVLWGPTNIFLGTIEIIEVFGLATLPAWLATWAAPVIVPIACAVDLAIDIFKHVREQNRYKNLIKKIDSKIEQIQASHPGASTVIDALRVTQLSLKREAREKANKSLGAIQDSTLMLIGTTIAMVVLVALPIVFPPAAVVLTPAVVLGVSIGLSIGLLFTNQIMRGLGSRIRNWIKGEITAKKEAKEAGASVSNGLRQNSTAHVMRQRQDAAASRGTNTRKGRIITSTEESSREVSTPPVSKRGIFSKILRPKPVNPAFKSDANLQPKLFN